MIICTGCGNKNDDECRFCENCGKKLQSSRQIISTPEKSGGRLAQFTHIGLPSESQLGLRRLLEAWGCLTIFGLAAGGCFIYETWWPLYPVVIVLGIILLVRRL